MKQYFVGRKDKVTQGLGIQVLNKQGVEDAKEIKGIGC